MVLAKDWEEGLAASLRADVAAAGNADGVVIVLGDQPRITREAVLAVAAAEGDAVRTRYDGTPGHPVAFGPVVLRRAPVLRGDVGGRDPVADVRTHVDIPGDPADVDTPADRR